MELGGSYVHLSESGKTGRAARQITGQTEDLSPAAGKIPTLCTRMCVCMYIYFPVIQLHPAQLERGAEYGH